MLLLIQPKRSTAGNWPKLGCQEKILLQLLDAFAAVLVRNNGVIAVTARPYDCSGKVEVLASYLGNGNSLTISQPWSPGQLINLIRNVFVSQNLRDLTVKQRTMVDPEKLVPKSFKKIGELFKLLKTFLTEIWWVLQWSCWIILTGAMYYRPSLTSQGKMDSKDSFKFHTWMIAKLIESSGTNKVPLSYLWAMKGWLHEWRIMFRDPFTML